MDVSNDKYWPYIYDRLQKKALIIPIRETWYDFKIRFIDFFLCCVYFNIPAAANPSKLLCLFKGRTIVILLDQDLPSIFAAFSKQTRNCIRQAGKLNMQVVFNVPESEFIEFYNLFAAGKRLSKFSDADFAYLDGNYQICKVIHNGMVCAMHLYILHKATGQVQLYRSASRRMFDGVIKGNIIGKANKYLHYQAINHFKQLAFHVYDFGGYSQRRDQDFEKFEGVNRFKRSFGGVEQSYQNYATVPYFLLKLLAGKMRIIK